MADLDHASDTVRRIGDFIADRLHELRRVGDGSDMDGDIQAATVFYQTIVEADTNTFMLSDRLYAIAVDLVECMRRTRKAGAWLCAAARDDGGETARRCDDMAKELTIYLCAWTGAVEEMRNVHRLG